MPPKKRVRRASRAASTVSHETPVATPAAPSESPIKPEVFQHALDLSDPWSDEQEISLFKAMIKWKPVGLSVHFVASLGRVINRVVDQLDRHAQTLQNALNRPAYAKPRPRPEKRTSYQYIWYLGKARFII
jgi:hypothetical protein